MPKPSEFESTTAPTGSEWMIVVKNGTTYKVALSVVKEYALSKLGMELTSTTGFKSYTDLGWTYSRDLGDNTTDSGASYVYEVSTELMNFDENIVRTVTTEDFQTSQIFTGLTPYQQYFSRVRAINGLPGMSNIAENVANPCASFSATRAHDPETGDVTLTVTTSDANEGVYFIEELVEDSIRGLVKPIANDEEGDLYMASGEGRSRTETSPAGGRMYFDCGFLKYFGQEYIRDDGTFYAHGWDESYVDDLYAADVPPEFSILGNAYNYCSANRETKTNKVLYINDQPSSADNPNGDGMYGVGGGANFPTTLGGIAQAVGSTLEHFDNNTTSPHAVKLANGTLPNGESSWKNYFKKYDVIIWIGSTRNNVEGMSLYTLSSTLLTGLMDAIDEGVGIITLTDHDIFHSTVNQVVRYFGVEYYGNIDRTATDDAYKISTILNNTDYIPQGFHPLLANLTSTSSIQAGVSEGKLRYVSHPDADSTNVGRTSSTYTSNASKTLTTTTHSDGNAITGGKLIVRTANDCGQTFDAIDDFDNSSQPPTLGTPITCTEAGGTFPGDYYIRINGSMPSDKDSNPGGFVAIHNPGEGFASIQAVIDALPSSIPYASGNMTMQWSNVTLDGNDGIATICLPSNNFTCGLAEDNGDALRYGLWAIGNNGELHILSTNPQSTTINHNSNGGLVTDWTQLFTQTTGVSYAVIEFLGNGSYGDDVAEDLTHNCLME